MTQRFQELTTAKAWGIKPSEWDELSGDDKGWMMALDQTQARMAAWEQEQNKHRR